MEAKIDIAKQIAKEIQNVDGILSADVDDFNKFGNFQVVAILELDKKKKPVNNNFSMRKVRAGIEKVLKNHASAISKFGKSIDSPKRIYTKYSYRNFHESIFEGYEKNYIMIDFVVT